MQRPLPLFFSQQIPRKCYLIQDWKMISLGRISVSFYVSLNDFKCPSRPHEVVHVDWCRIQLKLYSIIQAFSDDDIDHVWLYSYHIVAHDVIYNVTVCLKMNCGYKGMVIIYGRGGFGRISKICVSSNLFTKSLPAILSVHIYPLN